MHSGGRGLRCGQARNDVGGNGYGTGEIAAHGHVEQAARRVKRFLTVAAAHKSAPHGKLRGLDSEDGFAEWAARCQKHVGWGSG